MVERIFLMRIWIGVLFLLPLVVKAQFTYTVDQSVPVANTDGESLALPWTGGLNASQYNMMDLDGDGKEDLVLFDRMANKVVTYLRVEQSYRYAPEYEIYFPTAILNFVLLRDYNCDGKKDLFTGDNLGLKVFTNVTTPGNPPAWQRFLFSTGFGTKRDILLSKGFTSKVNVPLQFDDLPSVEDIDNDGDLDLLTMRYNSNGTVELHRNYSKERYGTCDSLDFERVTQAWGNFRECTCGVFAFNGQNCPTQGGGRTKHAGGKSLLLIDINGDQQKDLLISEAECAQLFALVNQGTSLNPVFSSSQPYPMPNPATMLVYPTPYFEDVDADGVKDLIATPNAFNKELINMDLVNSNWFYKNTGSTASPVFSFQQRNFLQDQMIDVGDNAVPAFVDVGLDGDYDLFISNNYLQGYNSTISYYENIGTPSDPDFVLRADDFLNLGLYNHYNRRIQFVDVNKDNTIDLAFTATSFDFGATSLYYILNKTQNGMDFSGQDIIQTAFTIGQNENIFLTDVDGDGNLDAIIGRGDGTVEYWKNDGGTLSFALEQDNYLGFGSSILRQSPALTSADLDGDGKTDLVMGDQSGTITIIPDYKNAVDGSAAVTNIIYNPLMDEGTSSYTSQNLGGQIWPAVVNLFNSNKPAIVVGSVMGGLSILKHDEAESLPRDPMINIFPNPVHETQNLNITIDRPAFIQVISIMGQQLSMPTRIQGFEQYTYDVSALSSGLYIMKFFVGSKTYSRKFVVN